MLVFNLAKSGPSLGGFGQPLGSIGRTYLNVDEKVQNG